MCSILLPTLFAIYRDLSIDGDYTSVHQAALGLVTLQKLYGRIPKVYGKGNYARNVWDLTKMLTNQDATINNPKNMNEKSLIDQMILIDRSVDFMSSLATQLTYTGLIDEAFGINNNIAQFPEERFCQSNESSNMSASSKKQIILNSNENLYTELRDQNFNAVSKPQNIKFLF
jgi:vacuolar protein sorting-associated protein 33A